MTSELNNVLLDERLELTNNLAERSIKPFVIDRKNFLFALSPNKRPIYPFTCYNMIE